MFAVERGPLGLAVGAGGAADVGAFVPWQAEPLQRLVDLGLGAGDEAAPIGVFDAQDELASGLAGEQEVVQGGARPADVQSAGGRGSESNPGGSFRLTAAGHNSIFLWRRMTLSTNPTPKRLATSEEPP